MKKTKFFIIFGSVFFLVGLGISIGAFFSFSSTKAFIASADRAQGKVVSLERRVSTDSDGGQSTSYYPVVEYQLSTGKKIVFTSSSGSSPASFRVGEKVEVLYDPQDPNQAKINAFFSKWGATLILSFMGAIFSLVGGIILFFGAREHRGRKWAKKYGREVKAKVTYVGFDRSYAVNGKNPWMVKCEWRDGLTNQLYTFQSESSWSDLRSHLNVGDDIRVKINMRNPKQHWVDTSIDTIRAAA